MRPLLSILIIPLVAELTDRALWDPGRACAVESRACVLTKVNAPHRRRYGPEIVADGDQGCAGFAAVAMPSAAPPLVAAFDRPEPGDEGGEAAK
jgi:hypothetical protein